MPRISITELKREVLGEAEPITLEISGRELDFPGTMPAEFELEQTRLNREMEAQGRSEMTTEENWRLVEAAFGSERYRELREGGVPDFDLTMAGFKLIGEWMRPYTDPEMPQRMQAALGLQGLVAAAARATTPNGSSTTGPSSRPTGNGSTPSISVVPSSASPESVPAASGPSRRASQAKR